MMQPVFLPQSPVSPFDAEEVFSCEVYRDNPIMQDMKRWITDDLKQPLSAVADIILQGHMVELPIACAMSTWMITRKQVRYDIYQAAPQLPETSPVCGKAQGYLSVPGATSESETRMITQPHQNKLRPIHTLANKAVTYQPDREAITHTAIPHFHIKERLDRTVWLTCTRCSAQLELDYSIGGMKSRLYAFCDEHEECKPQRMEISA